MNFIWATRGYDWGFRFLRTGGLDDPLNTYEKAFERYAGAPEVLATEPLGLAVRFADPEGRRDRAGRVIPHNFVVLSGLSEPPADLPAARELLWPLVAGDYAARYRSA